MKSIDILEHNISIKCYKEMCIELEMVLLYCISFICEIQNIFKRSKLAYIGHASKEAHIA